MAGLVRIAPAKQLLIRLHVALRTNPYGHPIPRDYPATVKKNELKPWQNKEWCIPAKENAEFVCAMEDVLDVYNRSYDETHPLICMDESSKQHLKETRCQPIPAKPGTVEKYDTEYERNGVSNMFMFFEPLEGKRHVVVTKQRTALD